MGEVQDQLKGGAADPRGDARVHGTRELEREVADTRRALDKTINELTRRLRPVGVVSKLAASACAVRDGARDGEPRKGTTAGKVARAASGKAAKATGKALWRAGKRYPLPLAATAAAAGWLAWAVARKGSDRQGWFDHRRYPTDTDERSAEQQRKVRDEQAGIGMKEKAAATAGEVREKLHQAGERAARAADAGQATVTATQRWLREHAADLVRKYPTLSAVAAAAGGLTGGCCVGAGQQKKGEEAGGADGNGAAGPADTAADPQATAQSTAHSTANERLRRHAECGHARRPADAESPEPAVAP